MCVYIIYLFIFLIYLDEDISLNNLWDNYFISFYSFEYFCLWF